MPADKEDNVRTGGVLTAAWVGTSVVAMSGFYCYSQNGEALAAVWGLGGCLSIAIGSIAGVAIGGMHASDQRMDKSLTHSVVEHSVYMIAGGACGFCTGAVVGITWPLSVPPVLFHSIRDWWMSLPPCCRA